MEMMLDCAPERKEKKRKEEKRKEKKRKHTKKSLNEFGFWFQREGKREVPYVFPVLLVVMSSQTNPLTKTNTKQSSKSLRYIV